MKRFKLSSLKNKRTLVIAGVSLLVIGIVGTIAYNQSSMLFKNLFQLHGGVVSFTEEFDSPNNWTPCQEVDKTAIATNHDTIPRYARMKINEYWRKNNTETPASDHSTTDLPLTWGDNGTIRNYAVINTQNDEHWTLRSDGYYYYDTALGQDESTLSLLKSVTMNCYVNLVGDYYYSDDGKNFESLPSDYTSAKYHLYIVMELSDEEWPEPRHTADCHNKELYDTIACLTNGPDDGIDFSEEGTAGNGLGVNTLSAHKDDNYPVYYYRGAAVDNHVLFGGYCWRAMQTTGTGGVKLFYNGQSYNVNGEIVCPDFRASAQPYMPPVMTGSNGSWQKTYSSGTVNNLGGNYAPHVGGYMYHPLEQAPSLAPDRIMGADVRWDGTNYTLLDYVTIRAADTTPDSVINSHRYYCEDQVSTTCSRVAYNLDYFYYIHHYILENGQTYDDAMHANDVASEAKTAFEDWYSRNMLSYNSKIEDTIYCNDRSLAGDGFDNYDYMYKVKYNVYVRNQETYQPSVDCIDKRDAFTVSPTIGNGANNYPIGTVTADDVTLAGGDGYMRIYTNVDSTWTMSPFHTDNDEFAFYNYLYGQGLSSQQYQKGILRPVISLKAGVKYSTGDGKSNSPFVIE